MSPLCSKSPVVLHFSRVKDKLSQSPIWLGMFYRLSPQAPLAITCLISPPTTSHFDLLTLLLHHSGLLINPPTFQAPPRTPALRLPLPGRCFIWISPGLTSSPPTSPCSNAPWWRPSLAPQAKPAAPSPQHFLPSFICLPVHTFL